MLQDQHTPEQRSSVSDVRLASVLETAPDGIIIINDQGRMLMFNKACEGMLGYTAAEVIGSNVAMLAPPEHAEAHDGYIESYLRTGHPKIIGIGRELRVKKKDGTFLAIDMSVGEAITPAGRQFIGILRDLTARKESDRRMHELQEDLIRLARISALDEMGTALAHELNQPLTALILYLQAVEQEVRRASNNEQGAPEKKWFEYIKKAQREAQRAASIIQQIRNLVEKRSPKRCLVNLNDIVADAVELTLIGQDRVVRVVRDLAGDLPSIEADAVQIQQVVVNLMRNAFEAVRGRQAAEVIVSTSLDDRHVLFCVLDNGPGIPPDQLADLFQAFKTGKRSGMGLGLAISRTIVQSHGGELLVEPGGIGRGARFVVRLPLSSTEAARENQPVELLSAGRGGTYGTISGRRSDDFREA
jgi:two-component system sensor kinase FixL